MVKVYRRERHNFWVLRAFQLGDIVELVNLGVNFTVSDVYEDVILPPLDEDTEL